MIPKQFPDGIYSFESKTSYALKKVKDGVVTYNDGSKVPVMDYISENKYTKVKRKYA